jgi:hypothetical protein
MNEQHTPQGEVLGGELKHLNKLVLTGMYCSEERLKITFSASFSSVANSCCAVASAIRFKFSPESSVSFLTGHQW